MLSIIENLKESRNLADQELILLIKSSTFEDELFYTADQVRKSIYGTDVYIRGLMEITNYCQNNCYYCGIRNENSHVQRYRLCNEEILDCCTHGYHLGFRTFVLQGGEDNFFKKELMSEIITGIKSQFSDCAITLSLGERSMHTYQDWFKAGADRYLLRHETKNIHHYQLLHPKNMISENRQKCLWGLKQIGFQVGSGFMVGTPYQTTEHIVEDLRFLQKLQPDMIGIGPYITHQNTPLHNFPNGDFHTCLRLIAILRLMFPFALIPATTALGTIDPQGREMGIKAGANVVMPNLTPVKYRKHYELYDHKISSHEEAAEGIRQLELRIKDIGYQIVVDIGHVKRES